MLDWADDKIARLPIPERNVFIRTLPLELLCMVHARYYRQGVMWPAARKIADEVYGQMCELRGEPRPQPTQSEIDELDKARQSHDFRKKVIYRLNTASVPLHKSSKTKKVQDAKAQLVALARQIKDAEK